MNKTVRFLLSFLIFFSTTASVFAIDNFSVGKDYYNHGSYYDASVYFQNAVYSNPKNINYKYYYALSLCKLLKLSEAQNQFQQIIQIAPYSEAAKKSTVAIADIQQYMLTSNSLKYSNKNSTSLGVDGTYIDNAMNQSGKLIRWDIKRGPLKIFISDGANVTGMQSYYILAVKDAIAEWMRELSKTISYVYVHSPEQANINIDFVPHLAVENSKTPEKISYEAGLTTPTYDAKYLRSVKIDMVTLTPSKTSFSTETIFNTALHEMGHALGIWGHSSDSKDVMCGVGNASELENKKSTLSSRDSNTIKLVYTLTPESVSSVLGDSKSRLEKKLTEAKGYVQKAPTMPISWVQLGNASMGLNKPQEALDAFNKALSLDGTYTEARVGLGNLYIKQNKYNDAITQYKYVVNKEPSNPTYSINLAELYYKTNNLPAAKSVIEALIKNNPDAISNVNIKNLLNKL